MMDQATARKIVRDLASQDNEDDERRAAAGWEPMPEGEVRWIRPAKSIVEGWRRAGREADDQGVIDAIDALGLTEAAVEYVAAVEQIATRH